MARGEHKGAEFHVEAEHYGSGGTFITKNFDEAAGRAVGLALSMGDTIFLDVVIWSKADARAYGGDDAVAQYNDDPQASIFERIIVRADSQGRVP